MAGRLQGKIALISGGATGMGGAASRLFAAEGAKVGIVDRNVEAGRAAVADIQNAGGTAVFSEADVAKSADVTRAVAEVNAALGAINVLFNHAGTIIIKPFLETSEEEWDWLMDVNVKSMFLMTKAVLPQMIAGGGGSIVCTSSISGIVSTPLEVAYSTTKGACHMFARAIAVDFRDKGIRCNAVCPGTVDTPSLLDRMTATGDVEAARKMFIARQPMGRLAKAEEIAPLIVFLASDESAFATGNAYMIDGGITI